MYIEYKEYNLMLDKNGEGFIGYRDDMINYYKEYGIVGIKERLYNTVRETMDLLEKLEKLDDNYLVYVDYPYNSFEVKVISEEV